MSFEKDIEKFTAKVEKQAGQYIRKVCFDLMSGIVYKTPVDTGRARANWQASIGSPKTSQLNTTDKGGGSTMAGASSAIANAPGNIFWISNNLPYIYRLEFEGWSKQAPKGMVGITVDDISRQLR